MKKLLEDEKQNNERKFFMTFKALLEVLPKHAKEDFNFVILL